MIKNTAGQKVGAQMVSATDGSAFTGAVTVAVTGDAGTQATGSVGSGACTHEGNGYHTYAPAQAETNYDLIAFTFTGTGAIPQTVQVYTVAGDAFTRLGAPAGASIAADIATRLASASYSAPPSAATIAAAVWDYLTAAATTVGSLGKLLVDNLNATISSRATQTSVDAVDDLIDTEIADIQSRLPAALVGGKIDANVGAISGDTVAADNLEAAADGTGYNLGGGAVVAASVTAGVTVTTNNDKTGYSVGSGGIGASSFAAGAIDSAAIAASAIGASELAQDAAREIADEVLDRDIAGGASGGARNVRSALRRLRNRARVSGGTATIYQEDDTTSAWTAAVTTTAGDPVSEVDPA